MSKIPYLIFLLLLLSLVACITDENPPVTVTNSGIITSATLVPQTLTSKPSVTPTKSNTPTSTFTPTHTSVPYVTVEPFPTVTPAGAYSTKQVFVQTGWTGGDGGSVQDFYFGRNTPSLVIYTDGQVIIQVGDWEKGFTFLSGQLPSEELCSLLGKLNETGYFNPIDEIYAFDETTQFSDGAVSYIIQANGPINKSVNFYGPYLDYLVDEMASAYELVSTYQPPTATAPYIPNYLLLWVEPITATDLESLPDWPAEFPPLADLRSDPSSSKVIVEGELILPLMELFDHAMTQKLFREGDKNFEVILRPLLPHKTPYSFSTFATQSTSFNLPFSCESINLPEVIPTSTPTPLVGTLSPATEELRGRLVFASDIDGDFEIYTMYANGSHVTQLTNYPGADTEPVWSPDGQKIAFVSDRPGRSEVFVMNADGTNLVRLTFGESYKGSPAWSPDGSRIAYVDSHNADFPDFDSEVHVIELEGNNPTPLTNNGSRIGDVTPIWLGSNQIIYASGDYPDYGLYLMQDNGSEKVFLSNGLNPALSPDGEQLAFVTNKFVTLNTSNFAEYNEIFVASLPDLISKHTATRITEANGNNYSPSWSPDGQQIVFVSERDGNSELYVMNADGSNPIRLTFTAATEQSPDWTP